MRVRSNAFFMSGNESRREREPCRLFIVSGEIPFPAATMIGPGMFKLIFLPLFSYSTRLRGHS